MSLAIVEVLEKKGPIADIDLQNELRSNFGEVSFRELNGDLMKTELAGVLREHDCLSPLRLTGSSQRGWQSNESILFRVHW